MGIVIIFNINAPVNLVSMAIRVSWFEKLIINHIKKLSMRCSSTTTKHYGIFICSSSLNFQESCTRLATRVTGEVIKQS